MLYRLSRQAKADLRQNWFYGVKNWGRPRADMYLQSFYEVFERLVEMPELGRPADDVKQGYRVLPKASHDIFYNYDNKVIAIIRILHQSSRTEEHSFNEH